MDSKEAYEQKMQAKIDEWNAEIEKLKARARMAEADVNLDYEHQVKELQQKRDEMQDKLDELRRSGDQAFDDLKAGLEMAKESMQTAMRSAMDRFRQ